MHGVNKHYLDRLGTRMTCHRFPRGRTPMAASYQTATEIDQMIQIETDNPGESTSDIIHASAVSL